MMFQGTHKNACKAWILILLQMFIHTVSAQGGSTYCDPDLGCFPNGPPWNTLTRPCPNPQNRQTVGTQIYCYTRASPERNNITLYPNIVLNGYPFNASRISVFITHGYLGNGNATWMDMLKTYYLIQDDANVCEVFWVPGANNINYFQAVSNARIVGAEVARFLKYLKTVHSLTADLVHLIGFSLGAHALSYSSNNFSLVARITGLDPAGPAYEDEDKAVRLDKGDARFVDVIHTSASPLTFGGFGIMKPCGHVDFYMNLGYNQPGCPLPTDPPQITSISDLANIPSYVLKEVVFCSHARSFMFFVSAVGGNCTFVGHRANYIYTSPLTPGVVTSNPSQNCTLQTCSVVGLTTPLYPARGVFQANTTSFAPYCEPNGTFIFNL